MPKAALDTSSLSNASTSVWTRISTWASEHKTVVYTIAGVTLVVTGAGAVYYFSNSRAPLSDEEAAERKKARKEKKKAKKEAGRQEKAQDAEKPKAEGR